MEYNNPILKGFNPDPSLCRVGADFYLVTSSFEFSPGVPIYHSKNLVNWELINYCLTDEVQLDLRGAKASGGIYAPTIRHHDGVFYMTTTNVSNGGNFIVHTKDIRGKWSAPIFVNQSGIDPSLLFDDGRCFYCSNGWDEESTFIQLSEINPLTGEFVREPVPICRGTGGIYPEAPHLYKIGEWYFLMLAEGGTQYGHMETIFRAKDPYGPYEPCSRNPILSHKDLAGHPIQCTGHADIVDDQNGNYWCCFLGVRPLGAKRLHNLGRETFLAPVTWDGGGFPIIGNNGTAELCMEGPLPAPALPECIDFYDDFASEEASLHYNYYGNQGLERFLRKDGCLHIDGRGACFSGSVSSPAFVGIRQKEFAVTAEAEVSLAALIDGTYVGITAFYNHSYHYDVHVTAEDGRLFACLRKRVHDLEAVTAKIEIEKSDSVRLSIVSSAEIYTFFCNGQEIGSGLTVGLCTEQTWPTSFTGTYFGMFAEGGIGVFTEFSVKEREPHA